MHIQIDSFKRFVSAKSFGISVNDFFKPYAEYCINAKPGDYWFTVCKIIFLENCNRLKQLKINLSLDDKKYEYHIKKFLEEILLDIKYLAHELAALYPADELVAFTPYDKERLEYDLKNARLITTKAKTNDQVTNEQNEIINYFFSNMHASKHISI